MSTPSTHHDQGERARAKVRSEAKDLLAHLREFFDAYGAAEAGPSERSVSEVVLEGTMAMLNRMMDLHARKEDLTALCPTDLEPRAHRAEALSARALAYMVEAARLLASDAEALERALEREATTAEAMAGEGAP